MPDLRPDPPNQETVSMQSSNQTTPSRASSEKTKLPSRGRAPNPPRKKRKRQHRSPSTQRTDDAEKYWAVRCILDERTVGGKVEYLIDWEDDGETGLSYSPTWEPEHHVTLSAIDSWVNHTQAASQPQQGSSSPAHQESTQDTDPVLPTDWRRAKRKQRTSLEPDAYGRRVELGFTEASRDGQIVIEFNQQPKFDRSEFHCINTSSAPASQVESNSSHPEPSQDGKVGRFSGDQRVIPDSQEASGNSLSQPHESQASLLRPSQLSESLDNGSPFLSQIPWDTQEQLENSLLPSSPEAYDSAPIFSALEPHQSLPSPSPSEEPSPDQSASQAAQIVEPLSDHGYSSAFQTQVAFDVFSDADGIVPDSVSRRGLGAIESQNSTKRTPTKMEGVTSSTSTPSSILRMRMEALRAEKRRDHEQVDDFESLVSIHSPKEDQSYESAQEITMGQQATDHLLDLPQAPPDVLPDTLSSVSHTVPEPASHHMSIVPALSGRSELHIADNADPVLINSVVHEDQPATLDPASLTLSIEEDLGASPTIPIDDVVVPGLPVPGDFLATEKFPAGQDQHDNASIDHDPYLLPESPRRPSEYHVTLPFYNSSRGPYNDIIREYPEAMTSYTNCFTAVPFQMPDNVTITKIDEMLRRLLDICDTPPFMETMTTLSLDQRAKHSASSNPKFAFVSDFLEYLIKRQSNKQIVIFIRPGQLFDLVRDIVETKQSAECAVRVSVISTSDMTASSANGADAIIAFDYTCRMELLPDRSSAGLPLILSLVCTASIQHLDMRVSDRMEPPERKNFLIQALVRAMRHVEDPEHEGPPPHEAAELFAKRLEIYDDDEFSWDSQSLPDDIFADLLEHSSQATHHLPNQHTQTLVSRKRLHDEDADVSTKRLRVSQPLVATDATHISDSLKSFLGEDMPVATESNMIYVPVDKLEAFMSRITQLESERDEAALGRAKYGDLCTRHEKELSSFKKWVNQMQPKYMAALKERGIYEEQYNKATKENADLKARLQARDTEIASLKNQTRELNEKIAEANESLRNSSDPNLSKMAELEKEVAVKRDEVQALRKQAEAAQRDMEFTRSQYQDASQRAAQIGNECRALEKEKKALEVKANANILAVSETQSRGEVEALLHTIEQLKASCQQRELEIEQLRAMKTSRRETRQASVPRSPRMSSLGINSPRPPARVTSAWSRESSASAFDSSNLSTYGSSTGHSRPGHLRS